MDNIRTQPSLFGSGRLRILLGALLVLALAPGCNVIYKTSVLEPDYYYRNPHKNLPSVGRAAIIELNNDSTYPQISADVTEALFQAAQKRQVFGVTVVRQSDAAWRSLQLDAGSTHTLEQLSAMRKTLKCNAAMIGTVTAYQPYPHMIIGLRLKLVDLADGQLLWAFEQVWDTADKETEKRIRKYFQDQKRQGFAPLREELVTISSLEFVKFVAYEVAGTL